MSELVFLFSADADIQEAFEFYETMREGQGEILLRHLDLTLAQLRAYPAMGSSYHGSYRKLLVPGFPYGIFYVIEGNRIVVSSFLDLRRDPKYIKGRLREINVTA